MFYLACTTGLEPGVWIKLVFPLMLGAGITLGSFGGFHVMQIWTGRTTLEHKVMLLDLQDEAFVQLQNNNNNSNKYTCTKIVKPKNTRPKSPFDQGGIANFRQALGSNFLLCLLPVHVAPPPPFVPTKYDKSS
eukprot:CAMPEP_0116561108 /NCGR_PEP_ID=MMETSP0397-20121206/11387_1 /TAXON_ID=216820 /ORGANISM="Cyclophora tenuis, Strain ECT3854" /LENGTH=132 /DNA_ID=CAMNT_0004087189 /DNA_START=168 /DNA_END=566 /DNA_ORIENTATION=+